MQQLKTAMALTTTHGLPRMVTSKPVYVRITWLLFFLFMLGSFLYGLVGFVSKLQANQVTNTLEVGALPFKFPDVYACFENPVSGSYAANIDEKSAEAINIQLNTTAEIMRQKLKLRNYSEEMLLATETQFSYAKIQSMPYNLLIDALAHRAEQSIITSGVTHKKGYGLLTTEPTYAESFYHPVFLRCQKWRLSDRLLDSILQTGSSAGLVATLIIDGSDPAVASNGADVLPTVFATNGKRIPVSDWSLTVTDFNGPDRSAGVRVFLTPPGEYPSDYVTSFSLGPGKHHTVEISMVQQVFSDNQFDCVSDAPDVQFVNPYDQSAYSHAYSYSYCYYYEYHRQAQMLGNTSGLIGPLPYPLRGPKYALNLTGEPTFFNFIFDPSLLLRANQVDQQTKHACQSRCPCSTLDYSVSISSTDWPTQSSLAAFVSSSVKQAWTSAKARNLSVPALDFLVTGNASSVASYVRSNLLKVHFKPHRVTSDKVTFSKDYNALSFISDVGGILGVYLGMSLLTLCELLELTYDLIVQFKSTKRAKPSQESASREIAISNAELSISSYDVGQ